MAKKIAIIACGSIHEYLICPAFGCFKSFNSGNSEFARYNGDAEIVGMIHCKSCPDKLEGTDKFLNRVNVLAKLGAEAIHFSTCMLVSCPYLNKHMKASQEKFPEIEFVAGTHGLPPGSTMDDLVGAIKDIIAQPWKDGVDMVDGMMVKAGTGRVTDWSGGPE